MHNCIQPNHRTWKKLKKHLEEMNAPGLIKPCTHERVHEHIVMFDLSLFNIRA